MHAGGHALHHVRGIEGGTGAHHAEQRYPPQIFPPKLHALQMQQTIIKLLEQWQKKQQRRNER